MLDLILRSGGHDGNAFWPVFLEAWPKCDDTWECRHDILEAMDFYRGFFLSYATDAERAFYDRLPNWITIYRGCSRDRVFGLSWTLDRKVAERFARGHRGIMVPDPVIAEAKVRTREILAVFTDRKEAEVLIDFTRLQRVKISNQSAIA